MGLVTKILKKNDNEYRSQDAKDALELEVDNLLVLVSGILNLLPGSKLS